MEIVMEPRRFYARIELPGAVYHRADCVTLGGGWLSASFVVRERDQMGWEVWVKKTHKIALRACTQVRVLD